MQLPNFLVSMMDRYITWGPLNKVMGVIATLCVFALYLLVPVFLVTIIFGITLQFGEVTFPGYLLITVPVYLVMFTIAVLGMRRFAIKKLDIAIKTLEQARTIRAEYQGTHRQIMANDAHLDKKLEEMQKLSREFRRRLET